MDFNIRTLQQHVNETYIAKGQLSKTYLTVDGLNGPQAKAAATFFQQQHGLVVDGKVGPATAAKLMSLVGRRFLSKDSYALAAKETGLEPRFVQALSDIEAKGCGFNGDGSLRILYERHHFYKYVKEVFGVAQTNALYAKDPEVCNPYGFYTGERAKTASAQNRYGGTAQQYTRLKRAIALVGEANKNLAYKSISMGLFQTMGMHHGICGFNTPYEMWVSYSSSEANQVGGSICNFISHPLNAGMKKAANDHNWAAFARLYNGRNYAVHQYDAKLRNAYNRLG